jgi:hypothetical protein
MLLTFALILAAIWLAGVVIVVGVCMSAAAGDRPPAARPGSNELLRLIA